MARLVAYARAGVEPQVRTRPDPAVKRVFEKAGLKPSDMDVVESNEAFAVQAMAVTKDLGLDPRRSTRTAARWRSATGSARPARSSP